MSSLVEQQPIVCMLKVADRASMNIYYYEDDMTSAYLSDLNVKEQYRGSGTGNIALAKAEQYCKSLGMSKLFLWVDRKSWVRKWYRRKGYKFVERHRVVVGHV